MARPRTPEQRAKDAEAKRIERQRNKEQYGVCVPGRTYINGKEARRAVPDPDDFAHPMSDVRSAP